MILGTMTCNWRNHRRNPIIQVVNANQMDNSIILYRKTVWNLFITCISASYLLNKMPLLSYKLSAQKPSRNTGSLRNLLLRKLEAVYRITLIATAASQRGGSV